VQGSDAGLRRCELRVEVQMARGAVGDEVLPLPPLSRGTGNHCAATDVPFTAMNACTWLERRESCGGDMGPLKLLRHRKISGA
jgi:hypothetical protein